MKHIIPNFPVPPPAPRLSTFMTFWAPLVIGIGIGLALSTAFVHAAETCQGLQCEFQTCSSDTCDDGKDTKACHPSHCRERYKGACKGHEDMCVTKIDDQDTAPILVAEFDHAARRTDNSLLRLRAAIPPAPLRPTATRRDFMRRTASRSAAQRTTTGDGDD